MSKQKDTNKTLLVEQLKKTPIVQIACEKIGLGRATYYRWKIEDVVFAKEADDAILEGSLLVNDLAESQLITAIKNSNLGAIVFWLKHHHPNYATKVEVTAHLKHSEVLTPEQEALVTRALQLASLIPNNTTEDSDGKETDQ